MKKVFLVLILVLSIQSFGNQIDVWTYPPETISSDNVDATNLSLAADENGNAIGVWIENGVVVSRSKLLNQSWDPLVALSVNGASSAQIVVDPSGNATAVWVESNSVKTADKPFGGSWSSESSLSLASSSEPQIAVCSNGDIVAVWVEGGVIKSSTKLFGGSWSATPDTLSSSGASFPQVAIGNNGDVFATWHAQDSQTLINTVYVSTKSISGSWSTEAPISSSNQNSAYAKIAVDASGNATAIWFGYNISNQIYSNVQVQSAYYQEEDLTWSTPESISTGGIANPGNLMSQIFYSSSGFPAAVWTNSYDGSNYAVQSSQRTMLQSWLEPSTLAKYTYAYSIDLAISNVNDLFVAYMANDQFTSDTSIYTRESQVCPDVGCGWSVPTLLSTGSSNGYPEITAVITGGTTTNAIAAWISFNGTNKIIQSVTGSGTLVIPPSNPAVSQSVYDSGLFDEYYNTITWSPSSDPNLSGYLIYRNGMSLTYLSSDVLSYIDHNQGQNVPVTYGIAALDSDNSESSIVYVSFP